MKRKFINALVFGAFLLAPASTFVSCSDYDDDIASLQDQIDQNADASNLSELVDQKLRNVDAEIESLNNVKEQLADALAATTDEAARQRIASAQALVDEAVTALTTARDNAEGLLDADKSLQTYLRADATLQEGIDRAQSCASRAYALAVQAEVDNVANNLNQIQQSLEGQIDVLQGDLDNLYDQVNNQETGILAQLAAINQLVEDIQNGMLDKDDLAGLASQEDLENLRTDLESQLPDIEQLKTELQGIMDQKIAAATENLASDQDVTNAVSAAITQLTTAYQTADQGLQSQITGLDGRVEKLEKDYSTLEGKVTEATGLVDAMSNDLNNLVTGIILQDNQLQFVYAQVASEYIGGYTPGSDARYLTKDAQGRTIVHFPYVGAAGEATLYAGHWNVEGNGGLIYATVNPTRVDFTGKVDLQLENSLGNAPANIEVGEAMPAKDHLITTRAAGTADDKAENGLYAIRLTNTATDRTEEPAAFENSYALYTSFNLGTRKNEETGDMEPIVRKVYSKYALNIEMVKAGKQYTPVITPVEANGVTPITTGTDGVARYVVEQGEPLTGNFTLNPQTDANEKGDGVSKPFRKYVEVTAVKDQRGNKITGATLNRIVSDVHNNNSDALQKVFTEPAGNPQDVTTEANGFDQISVTVPDTYNGYTFTFTYYVQNWDGTIVSDTQDVLFTKPLFSEEGIAFSHTPTSKAQQTANCPDDVFMSTNCMGANNSEWEQYTASIEVESDVALQEVYFYDGNEKEYTVKMNDSRSGSFSPTTQAGLQQVDGFGIKYDPADLEVNKEYNITITFYDTNGNVVSVLPVKFTMLYPTKTCVQVLPNPAYFMKDGHKLPENATIERLDDTYQLTAWAVAPASVDAHDESDEAEYGIISAFNTPWADGTPDLCHLEFDLANKATYYSGQPNAAYMPVTTLRFPYNAAQASAYAATDYIFTVPKASVRYGSEHVYTMQVAVNYFNVPTLWADPQEFQLVFKSPIMYVDAQFDQAAYTVGYPGDALTITDADIFADDPSISGEADNIKYFKGSSGADNQDKRIQKVEVYLQQTQYASLFKTPTVTNEGIVIETVEQPQGGTGAISATNVEFRMKVTDQFGNVREYPFYVNVDPNEGQNQTHRK